MDRTGLDGNRLRVLQIAPTLGQPCGVGNFAQSLELALRAAGVEVVSRPGLDLEGDCDVVLVQHEWAIIQTDALRGFCKNCPTPVILFGHTSEVSVFDDVMSGYIVMARQVAGRTVRPCLTIHHPAYVPKQLRERPSLRHLYGLPEGRIIVGSSGFLLEARRFTWFVEQLLDLAVTENFFVYLLAPEHKRTPLYLKQALKGLAETFPDYFKCESRFLPCEGLNLRLQACDLLWCWTEVAEQPAYVSGVASDMYGSGTRLVLADKRQHEFIAKLPNVVQAPAERTRFLQLLHQELSTKRCPRHDPALVSWETAATVIAQFLETVCAAGNRQLKSRSENSRLLPREGTNLPK